MIRIYMMCSSLIYICIIIILSDTYVTHIILFNLHIYLHVYYFHIYYSGLSQLSLKIVFFFQISASKTILLGRRLRK